MAERDVDALLGSVTGLGRRLFDAAACSVALLEPDEEHLVFRAASGAGGTEVVGVRLPVSRGIAGWVISSGQPIAVRDVRADPRFAREIAESTGYVPQSILAAPMEIEGEVVGVVEVLDRGRSEARDDMALLTLFAAHAALTVRFFHEATPPRRVEPDLRRVEPDLMELLAELSRLGPAEQQAVAVLLTAFLSYVERRGGPAGLV